MSKPSGNPWRARLEERLLGIWYQGQPTGFWLAIALNGLTLLHRLARFLSQQSTKVMQSKTRTQPAVLVIGNLIAGGAGKTPIVMAVCQHCAQRDMRVGVVSRGYGRRNQLPCLLNQTMLASQSLDQLVEQFGDEPVFLAQQTGCPVAVGQNRQAAVDLLCAHHPDLQLVVSDDGLQHHRLQRSLEWVVFDRRGQGNGRLLPAGPLREPSQRLGHVDAVLASNVEVSALADMLQTSAGPHWHAVQVRLSGFTQPATQEHLNCEQALARWRNKGVAAFTGLGNPDKLFSALRTIGLSLARSQPLPDHFQYPADYCKAFTEDVLITTGKDAVKLVPYDPRLWVANIEVELPAALTQALEDHIGHSID